MPPSVQNTNCNNSTTMYGLIFNTNLGKLFFQNFNCFDLKSFSL